MMTLDDAEKIDTQAFIEMQKERVVKQAELEAYYKGYEQGLEHYNRLLRNHITLNEKDGEQK